jgi:hypothetical protein
MPKAKVRVGKSSVYMTRKNRIGYRKGGKSAHQMKTDDLLAVLTNDSQKRWKSNAMRVLRLRGVEVPVSSEVQEVQEG